MAVDDVADPRTEAEKVGCAVTVIVDVRHGFTYSYVTGPLVLVHVVCPVNLAFSTIEKTLASATLLVAEKVIFWEVDVTVSVIRLAVAVVGEISIEYSTFVQVLLAVIATSSAVPEIMN